MKKNLFSFIPVNPIFFIFLSISILYSGIVFAATGFDDTACYYNERGKLLWRNVHAMETASYVIRTKKTYQQIFQDIPADDSTVAKSAAYNTAEVNNIQRATARKVKRLIKRGLVCHPLVVDNLVPVLDKRTIYRMYDNIASRCVSAGARNKEHGGVVFPDGTVTCISGDLSDPRWLQGATLMLKEKAMVYYHSHPGTMVEKHIHTDRANLYNSNTVRFIQASQVQQISYVQGPSRQDQQSVGEGTGYVFGMKDGCKMIFIYDKNGVNATLPISFVKKMGKSSNQPIKRADSWLAVMMPAMY
ncbi:hypothetical protein [Niastella populi]|uniref:Uncharacterized protein n=1 Tax=Niastella populi TaxID=550983 RepID=A0A1V9FXK3_9BACT|nr:hypothetical protein [Niastella populi]OQP63044.1 hypothetical protein A4R26_17870 [Niastella populi]